MFRIACGPRDRDGWSIPPSEFWQLCPYEWWLLFDAFVGDRIAKREAQTDRLNRLFDQHVKKQ